MSKHTPGPWSYEVHELSSGHSGIVYDATGYRVGTDHLTEADARLIAAAPEMLEALKQAREYVVFEAPNAVFEAIDAVIAKAEGR